MLLMVSAGIAMTPTAMGADLPGVPTSIEVGQQYSVNLLNYLPGTITSANIPTVNWGKAEPGHIWAVTVDGKNPAVIPNVSFAAGDSSNPKLLFTATWDSPGQHVIWVRLFHQAQPGLFHEVTWTINVVQAPYIVTFNSDGGSFVPSRQVAVGDPYGTLPTPTRPDTPSWLVRRNDQGLLLHRAHQGCDAQGAVVGEQYPVHRAANRQPRRWHVLVSSAQHYARRLDHRIGSRNVLDKGQRRYGLRRTSDRRGV